MPCRPLASTAAPFAHGLTAAPALVGRGLAEWAALARSAEQALAALAKLLGGERLGQVGVGAEREAPLDVLLGAERRDDEQRRRAMVLGLADEADKLQAVDVGHVDVGDDEVVGAARQQAHGVEPAARLRHLTPPCLVANSGASSTARTNARAETESSTTRTFRMPARSVLRTEEPGEMGVP